MSNDNTWTGYVIRGNWRSIEFHTFDATTHKRISAGTCTPQPGLSVEDRKYLLKAAAQEYGIEIKAQ